MSLIILIGSTFTHWLSIYGSRPYISLLVVELGGDNMKVGLVASAYSLVQVILALQVSRSIDRFGAKRTIIVGNMFLVAGLLWLSSARSLVCVGLCSALLGIAHVLVMISAQYIATGFSGPISKEKAVGYYTLGNSAGIFLGPTIGAAMHTAWGMNKGFLGGCAFAVLSLIIAFFIHEDRREQQPQAKYSALDLLKVAEVRRVLLLSSMVMFSSELTTTYFPVHGQTLGFSLSQIGTVLSVSGMAMMLIRPFTHYITQHFPMQKVLRCCLILAGAGIACYGLITGYYTLLMVAAFSGAALGLLGPLTMIAATDVVDALYRSKVLALRTMINFFGQSASPVLFGALSIYFGLTPVFIIGGTTMAVCSLLTRKGGGEQTDKKIAV